MAKDGDSNAIKAAIEGAEMCVATGS